MRPAFPVLLLTLAAPPLLPGDTADPPREDRPLGNVIRLADPTNDAAWGTEAFSQQAQAALNLVTDALKHDLAAADRSALEAAATPGFRSSPLTPETSPVFTDHTFTVRRTADIAGHPLEKTSFLDQVAAVHARLADRPGKSYAKIKIVNVDLQPDAAATKVFFHASRAGREINATWDIAWQLPDDPTASPPLYRSIHVLAHEETDAVTTPGQPLLADCTEALLGHLDAYQEQLAYGSSHWYGNLDGAFGVNQANQGLAVADVNGDGLDDLYVCQPDGLPNRLFIRGRDGRLTDRSRTSGIDLLDISRSALFVDLDNDGDQDFIISHRYSASVYANDGFANFTHRATIDFYSRVSGICAADYDNDGDIDFFVCGYSPKGQMDATDIFANPVPYHDANNGALNYLMANDGDFNFSDATKPANLTHNHTRYSFTASWEDFDNDGDQDLYIANDFGRNNLYRNELVPSGKATFTDVAPEFGAEDVAAGMSVAWGDYNNDGTMDLYISNMWSSAGNRIAFQRQFKPGTDPDTVALLQRHARGNSLFKNVGPATPFEDVSIPTDVTMGRWAWGSTFADINNDGWEDILVANGFMTAPKSGDL